MNVNVMVVFFSELAKELYEPAKYFDEIVWPAYLQCLSEHHAEDTDIGTPFENVSDRCLGWAKNMSVGLVAVLAYSSGNVVRRMNEVIPHLAGLLLGWADMWYTTSI